MQVEQNFSLKNYNTFRVDARARYFAGFSTTAQLIELTSPSQIRDHTQWPFLILGGGSNMLLTEDFDGIVLKNDIKGIEMINEDADSVYVSVGAGENWHSFVLYCIEHGWAGIENLSLIPGNVGAAPMQNIGAYGVELKDVFHELKAFHLGERANYTFGRADCEFAYRESVFKNRYKNLFVILNVTLRLNKVPRFNTSYGAVEQELDRMGIKELSIGAISQAVINIRRSKLPDPAAIGNAGSFFKNPSIASEQFQRLRLQFPAIVGYNNEDGTVKLAAGWLIEHCGPREGVTWKGFRKGDAGCHDRQALVLVNYGHATGREILALADEIRSSVLKKFGVELEREVNVV